MTSIVEKALESLRTQDTPQRLSERIAREGVPAGQPPVNAHIHLPPNFSAFGSVDQAIEMAASEGIGVLGVSNYYDFSVYGPFIQKAHARGIYPLFGLEIIAMDEALASGGVKLNDPGNPGKMYICGKGITRFATPSPRGAELLDLIRRNDAERMAAMIDKLEAVFAAQDLATGLTHDGVIDRIVARYGVPRETVHLQERHICQAFQEVFFEKIPLSHRAAHLYAIYGDEPKSDLTNAVAVQNEIRSQLMKTGKPAYAPETFVTPVQARELILELGGLPIYPVLADGVEPMCGFETPVENLVEQMRAHGFVAAEFIPLRNSNAVLAQYVKTLRAAGLIVTAGTEHNTLDLIPIEPSTKEGEIAPDLLEIFWEGACVVAAHQFLVLNGQCGFVDGQGQPNPDYATTEERIKAFSQIGAALIQDYRAKSTSH